MFKDEPEEKFFPSEFLRVSGQENIKVKQKLIVKGEFFDTYWVVTRKTEVGLYASLYGIIPVDALQSYKGIAAKL